MNILIVDDEVIVVNLLKKHVGWKELGIEEVFTSYTAMEARRIVADHQVDIIVCDIEMPQESGLTFLTWIRENYPETVKIILTGYPDFGYAQNAIEIGVVKYLLKPVSFEELSETVRFAVKEVEQKRRMAQKDMSQNALDPKREEKIFYTNLITGDILPFSEFIDKAARQGGLDRSVMEPDGLVYIRLAGAQIEVRNNSVLLFALSNIAEELFEEITEIHLWDNIFWIIRSGAERIEQMCELFISRLKGRFHGEIYAYFTRHVVLENLAERAMDLRHAAMQYRNMGQSVYDVDELIETSWFKEELEGADIQPMARDVVEAVKKYIHEHYMGDISRQDMEEAVHLNGDYLNRIFKKATGYSLVQYIQYYRILVSKRLLAERTCTITEAGLRVGFDTPSYFTKVFKKWTNMTPYEYYSSLEG